MRGRPRLLPSLRTATVLLVCAGGILPGRSSAQVRWQDLVFTGGVSGEGYRGNLASVTAPAVDSTTSASAAVGEMGIHGELLFFNSRERTLELIVDGGLRQFSAQGFKVRDYAPRELVGRGDLRYREYLSSVGDLWIEGGISGRNVDDRPPMPLYIQPGYMTADARVRFQFLPVLGLYVDATVLGEVSDYSPTPVAPQLVLLDRKVLGGEAGISWGPEWTIRAHVGLAAAVYENQSTFDPADPHRRDRTFSVGATWTKRSSYLVQFGVEGRFNRSNSSRPEYDALRVRAVASAPLPRDMSLTFFADLTDKEYLTQTEFARLVPGEEADNASVIYLELARSLMVNLDGALRFGWNRAETDIGDSYFERFGATFLLRYRPRER